MRLAFALLFVVMAVAAGCSNPMNAAPPTAAAPQTPTSGATAMSAATAPDTTASPTVQDAQTPTPAAAATPTATATPTAMTTPTPTPRVVHVELPDWAEESPQMASQIANSDVIAEVRFLSLESTAKEHSSRGFVPELSYTFEAIQYLKGDGGEKIVVREIDVPSSDVITKKSEEEARSLAEGWLRYSKSAIGDKQNAILFLRRNRQTNDYSFEVLEVESSKHIAFGTYWLDAVSDSMYRHVFMDGKPTIVSVFELRLRIEQLRLLTEGEYGRCVSSAINLRDRVRRQTLGTYQEMDIAGWRAPEPFPRFEVSLASRDTRNHPVFEFRRPPYKTPFFSDYWLDGKDRDLFTIDNTIYPDDTYEAMAIVGDLQQGVYSVYYSQYHEALPCDDMSPHARSDWRSWDTAEWVVNVK